MSSSGKGADEGWGWEKPTSNNQTSAIQRAKAKAERARVREVIEAAINLFLIPRMRQAEVDNRRSQKQRRESPTTTEKGKAKDAVKAMEKTSKRRVHDPETASPAAKRMKANYDSTTQAARKRREYNAPGGTGDKRKADRAAARQVKEDQLWEKLLERFDNDEEQAAKKLATMMKDRKRSLKRTEKKKARKEAEAALARTAEAGPSRRGNSSASWATSNLNSVDDDDADADDDDGDE